MEGRTGSDPDTKDGRIPDAFGVQLRPPFFGPGRWVAPLNYATDVRERWIIPDRVQIHDVTLRDGEQTARIVFTPDEMITSRGD